MGYRLLADVTMVVHFGFIVFVVLGGFLAWRWRSLGWMHVPAALWGLAIVTVGVPCPLTWVENWARAGAGQQGLKPTGFIDTYIEGVIYPTEYATLLQALAAAAVLVSWTGLAHGLARSRNKHAAPHLP